MTDGWPFVGLLLLAVLGLWAVGSARARDRDRASAERQARDAQRTARAQAPYTPQTPMLTHWQGGHYAFTGGSERAALPALPMAAEPTALPLPVPTFAQMHAQGLIRPGAQLIIAYRADGTPRWGSWLDLYNLLMLGLSGYGKSTAARYLACWHVINGGKLILIDPHGKSGEESLTDTLAPLHAAFLCDPATDAGMAVRSFRMADSIMRRRLEGGVDEYPLLVVVDELPEVMTYHGWAAAAPLAAEYLAVGNKSGRKKRCYTLATSQLGTVDQLGGGAVQQSFVAVAAFRSKRRQAQLLDFERDEKAAIARLPVGSSLVTLAQSTEAEHLFWPNTTPEDGARIAATLANGATATPGYTVATNGVIDLQNYVAKTSLPLGAVATGADTAAAREAADLFLSGLDMAPITTRLTGIKSNEGARFQKANETMQEAIRQELIRRRHAERTVD